jgi:hypothetical protein
LLILASSRRLAEVSLEAVSGASEAGECGLRQDGLAQGGDELA